MQYVLPFSISFCKDGSPACVSLLMANTGMFLIDDFGRQMISPTELLNRWIVPLESEIDFLRLQSGQTLVVPFRQLIVFSTNLDPAELVDDANAGGRLLAYARAVYDAAAPTLLA